MKLATRTPIVDLDGRSLVHTDGKASGGPAATFASIVIPTLLERMPEDRSHPERSLLAVELAKRIQRDVVVDLTPTEAAYLKKRVFSSAAYNNLVIARIFELLDKADAMAVERSLPLGGETRLLPLEGGVEEV